mgnify:CR=1 FL=1
MLHSSQYEDGKAWKGKRALVIGTGNSGHDIAQDLHSSGAQATLVQRSPTLVINIEPSAQLVYGIYGEGPPLEDCDLVTMSIPLALAKKAHIAASNQAKALDRELLERLERKGFKLDYGEDGTGWQFKYLSRGGGYYFNVGCSELIADGKIRLIQFAEELVRKGKAFVCDLTPEQTDEYRRNGLESPFRNRGTEENLDLFRRMKAGEFADGVRTLRAKIDMSSPNIWMRDPLLYRIRHAEHHHTGGKWCIYPMYDFAHCLSDYIEGITHSICTLEFEVHRPLYDWFIDSLSLVTTIIFLEKQFGITVPPGTTMQLKNVAAVMVTASLPPFAQRAVGLVGSYVGNLQELKEVVALAKKKKLRPAPVEVRPAAEVSEILENLKAGKVLGRVVLAF